MSEGTQPLQPPDGDVTRQNLHVEPLIGITARKVEESMPHRSMSGRTSNDSAWRMLSVNR